MGDWLEYNIGSAIVNTRAGSDQGFSKVPSVIPLALTARAVVSALNGTYPLIRFGTGDLATYDDAPCACGRTSPRLLLVGRVGEAVKVRGMFVHPNQLKLAASKFPMIARVQGIVRRPDNVRDEFILKVGLAQAVPNRDQISKDLANAIREQCRVGVDRVEFVDSIAENARAMVDERKWERESALVLIDANP